MTKDQKAINEKYEKLYKDAIIRGDMDFALKVLEKHGEFLARTKDIKVF